MIYVKVLIDLLKIGVVMSELQAKLSTIADLLGKNASSLNISTNIADDDNEVDYSATCHVHKLNNGGTSFQIEGVNQLNFIELNGTYSLSGLDSCTLELDAIWSAYNQAVITNGSVITSNGNSDYYTSLEGRWFKNSYYSLFQ